MNVNMGKRVNICQVHNEGDAARNEAAGRVGDDSRSMHFLTVNPWQSNPSTRLRVGPTLHHIVRVVPDSSTCKCRLQNLEYTFLDGGCKATGLTFTVYLDILQPLFCQIHNYSEFKNPLNKSLTLYLSLKKN